MLKNHWPTLCSKAYVLRDWRIVALEENGGELTFLDLFQGIRNHQFDHKESFVMPKDFAGSPLKCELGGGCGGGWGIKYQNQPDA